MRDRDFREDCGDEEGPVGAGEDVRERCTSGSQGIMLGMPLWMPKTTCKSGVDQYLSLFHISDPLA